MERKTVCILVLFSVIQIILASEIDECGSQDSVKCQGTSLDAQLRCPFGLPIYNDAQEIPKKFRKEINSTGIWMGYYSPGSWFTLRGDVVKWGNWKFNFSEYAKPDKDCIFIELTSKKWINSMCNESRHGLCQNDLNCLNTSSSDCLWVSHQSGSMDEVEKNCHLGNGTLAVFTKQSWEDFSQEFSTLIHSQKAIFEDGMWIGITKNQVIWGSQTGDDIVWTNWQSGEPQSSRNKRCAIIDARKDNMWRSEDCSKNHSRVVCQKIQKHEPTFIYFSLMNVLSVKNITASPEVCKRRNMRSFFNNLNFDSTLQLLWMSSGLNWIHATNRMWYTLSGNRIKGLSWGDDNPVMWKENRNCVNLFVTRNRYMAYLKESYCSIPNPIYGICELQSIALNYYSLTINNHTNINDAQRDCSKQGGLLAVPGVQLYATLKGRFDKDLYWVGITDEPRFWFNMEGEKADIVVMGKDDENCLKAVMNGDNTIKMVAANCEEKNFISCAERPTTLSTTKATNGDMCKCPCTEIQSNLTIAEIKKAVLKRLIVETKNLSTNIRKRISAPDKRPSSKYMGSTAIFILLISAGIIIFPDVFGLLKCINRKKKNFKCL